MTGMLKSVLREHADTTPAPHVDLDAIVSTGNRRVRRARVTTGLGALAVTSVLAVGVTVLPGLLPGSPPPEGQVAGQSPTFGERRAGFATGQVIHWGGETFSVGAPVVSYVQTDDGFVYVTKDGEVHLFDGASSTAVGRVGNDRLYADDSGSLVAWVDVAGGAGRTGAGEVDYVVYDTATRSEVARVADDAAGAAVEPSDRGGRVLALDDGRVYWERAEGVAVYDVATAEETLLAERSAPTDPATKDDGGLPTVVDVAASQLAFTVDTGEAGGEGMHVGASLSDGRPMPSGWHGVLSPGASYLAVEQADVMAVYDARTAEDVTPRLRGYEFAVVYGWSGDSTALLLGIEDVDGGGSGYESDFLSCEVPTGQCEVVTSTRLTPSTVLPVGQPAT